MLIGVLIGEIIYRRVAANWAAGSKIRFRETKTILAAGFSLKVHLFYMFSYKIEKTLAFMYNFVYFPLGVA